MIWQINIQILFLLEKNWFLTLSIFHFFKVIHPRSDVDLEERPQERKADFFHKNIQSI